MNPMLLRYQQRSQYRARAIGARHDPQTGVADQPSTLDSGEVGPPSSADLIQFGTEHRARPARRVRLPLEL